MRNEPKLSKIHFNPDEIHHAVLNNEKVYFFQFTNKALQDLC